MRRVELLIKVLREMVELPHADGDRDSISNLEFVQALNDAQDHVHAEIVNAHSNFFLTSDTIDLIAQQQQYSLPTNIFLGSKIKKVEYRYGGVNEYYQIPPLSEFDITTNYSSSWPYGYTRGNNYLKITPLPDTNQTDGLRVTYTKKLRSLDIRRGIIESASKTGSTLNSLTLYPIPPLSKDEGTTIAARELLNYADYICVVDSDGVSVLDTIPIDSYDSTSGVITVRSGFTTSISASTFANMYVVSGSYSTTHSELPDNCERYLILYTQLKMLRRQNNQFEVQECRNELTFVHQNILNTFANPDDDFYYLDTNKIWDNTI